MEIKLLIYHPDTDAFLRKRVRWDAVPRAGEIVEVAHAWNLAVDNVQWTFRGYPVVHFKCAFSDENVFLDEGWEHDV